MAWDAQKLGAILLYLAGVISDLLSRRIRNSQNLITLVFAIFLAFTSKSPSQTFFDFVLSLVISLLISFAVVTPAYVLKIMGGGDLKLFVAISPLFGWQTSLWILVYSFFWGALLGLTSSLLHGKILRVFANLTHALQKIFRGELKVHNENAELSKIPYSVALLFGALSVLIVKHLTGSVDGIFGGLL